MELTRKCATCTLDKMRAEFGQPGRSRRVCNQCRAKANAARHSSTWVRYFERWLLAARQRGKYPVEITAAQLVDILVDQGGTCALTGKKLTRVSNNPCTASVDRIENAAGYVPSNVRITTWRVNCMRNDMTDDEFAAWVDALATHRLRQTHGTVDL